MTETKLNPIIGQRQTVAGTVVGGVRQPELKPQEIQAIITADNPPSADDATKKALARQSRAGIGGEPELTTEERQLIVTYNNNLPTRH